jgi:hypothetical protein
MRDDYLDSNIDLFVMSFALHNAYTYIIPKFGIYMTRTQYKKYKKDLRDKKRGIKKKKKNTKTIN